MFWSCKFSVFLNLERLWKKIFKNEVNVWVKRNIFLHITLKCMAGPCVYSKVVSVREKRFIDRLLIVLKKKYDKASRQSF